MTTPHAPTKYLGPDQYLGVVVVRQRPPTGADFRQPETGKYYPIGCIWQVGKNPTSGVEGDLYMLAKIAANVASWLFITNDIEQIESFVTNISGPVLPNADGEILVDASITTFTDGSVANTLKTEVQATDHLLVVGRGTNVAAGTITLGGQGGILAQNNVAGDPAFTRTVNGDGNMTFQAFTSAVGHFLVSESDFTASGSNAGVVASCVGGAGIPTVGCTISATRFFADMIDQTDSNSYKLLTAANSSMTAGTTLRRVSTAGAQTLPLQPCFEAQLSANIANATGDGTIFQIPFDTVLFDQGTNFTPGASAVFTAPQTGKYQFSITIAVSDLSAGHDDLLIQLATTGNDNQQIVRLNPFPVYQVLGTIFTGSRTVSMNAGDTASAILTVDGSTKTVTVLGLTEVGCTFSGSLIC